MNEIENSGQLPSLRTTLKYTLVITAIIVSGICLFAAKSLVITSCFLILAWVFGYYLYKRRAVIMEWNDAQVPVKDFILTKKQEKEALAPRINELAPLDTINSDSLTQHEAEKWDKITQLFYTEDKFDKPKSRMRRKKGKND